MPYEVVEHILRHLHKTKDLLNLAKSSKRCYQLALPCLYRHVNLVMGRLRTYPSLATNLKLHTAARSLRVCSRSTNPATDHKLPLIPSIKDNPANLSKKPFGKVDRAVFKHAQTTLCLLPHFQNLQSITLRGVPLPRSFYQSLHVLARLERLTLRACRLTTRYPRGYDPGTLGITELTLLQMRQNETSLPKLKGLLKLARSQALRTLRMDRSMEIALSSLVEYGLPHTLQRLELDFRGTVPRGRKPFELLFKFLNSCKHIRHLELTDMGKLDGLMEYPIRMQLRRDALPCLTSLTIPSAYVGLFTRSRNINSLTITDVVANHPPLTKHMELKDVASILRLLQISSITLESLKFNFNWWDKELFYMLAAMTNMVKELVITYQQGLPDDVNYFTVFDTLYPDCRLLGFFHVFRKPH